MSEIQPNTFFRARAILAEINKRDLHLRFTDNVMKDLKIYIPEDPIGAVKGMLKHVEKTSVELQHEASKIRAERAMNGS